MPGPEQSNRHQKACLWAFSSYDAYGQPTVATDHTEILVRWENTQRTITDPQGNVIGIDAAVYTDTDITLHSQLWLGASADLPNDGIPTTEKMVVKAFDLVPDIKGRKFYREALLQRYRDS